MGAKEEKLVEAVMMRVSEKNIASRSLRPDFSALSPHETIFKKNFLASRSLSRLTSRSLSRLIPSSLQVRRLPHLL